MKHLLNNLTEEEKNSIRGQHTGGMNVVTENFSKLINTKSGDAKLFLKEDSNTINEGEGIIIRGSINDFINRGFQAPLKNEDKGTWVIENNRFYITNPSGKKTFVIDK